MSELLARLERIIIPLVESKGYEVVELKLVGTGRSQTLKVYIWKQGGVTIDDCERISEQISYALDMEDIFKDRYYLEVSSPGLDRPLRTLKDFERAVGEKIDMFITDGKTVSGRIVDVSLDGVTLEKEKTPTKYPWEQIAWGKIIVEFK